MDALSVLLVLVALALTILVITAPLRGRRTEDLAQRESVRIADLEAAKEAKYGEIRDAELDLHTGKLSQEDWRVIDHQLRAEAVEILRQLDAAGAADQARFAAERAERAAGAGPAREEALADGAQPQAMVQEPGKPTGYHSR